MTRRRLAPLGDLLAALTFVLVLLFGAGLAGALLTGCPANTPRRVAIVSIVGAGSAVRALRDENEATYIRAVDALRARSATRAEYEAALRPIDAVFMQRTRAIAIASSALYATARIVDGASDADGGAEALYRAAAADTLVALRHALELVTQAEQSLPPLGVPPQVRDASRALEALAGAPSLPLLRDAGALP